MSAVFGLWDGTWAKRRKTHVVGAGVVEGTVAGVGGFGIDAAECVGDSGFVPRRCGVVRLVVALVSVVTLNDKVVKDGILGKLAGDGHGVLDVLVVFSCEEQRFW